MAECISAVVFSVSVLLKKGDSSRNIVRNSIRKTSTKNSWYDLFEEVTQQIDESPDIPSSVWTDFEKHASISVSSSQNGEQFHPDPYDIIKTLHEFDKSLKYVTIQIEHPDKDKQESNTSGADRTVNDVLMLAQTLKKQPSKIYPEKERFTAKDQLYNDVVDEMNLASAGFPATYPEEMIRKNVGVIVDALWYIDANHQKLNKLTTKLPSRFEKFSGYNDFKKKRKAQPKLTSQELKIQSSLLFQISGITFAKSWGSFRKDLENLAVCLDSYAAYLEASNEQQKYRQSLSVPVRQVSEHAEVVYIPSCNGPVENKYSILEQVLKESQEYEPIFFDESIHINTRFRDRFERRRFIQGINVSHNVDLLKYDPGAGLGQVVFLWRVPPERSPTEMMNSAAKMHSKLKPRLSEYHTREMRREFSEKYRQVISIPPHIMRSIYADLTMDATADQNPTIDERLRIAIMSEDPEMVIDLRHLNKGRPDNTFDVFFEQLDKILETVTAADERRHNVEHMSKFISVRDMIEETVKQCPPGTAVPSKSTVLFAFVPRNAYVKTAKLYKGRVSLQHKVQTRQLRVSHIDEHYCAAIFSYMKQYSNKFKEHTNMICIDDKSKVDFGEPGLAVASGVRGKKSIVPVTSTLSALDHDINTKGSITPSVCLKVDIPDELETSFYRGQVAVTLKDSVFEPSTPFRHAVELKSILKSENETPPPFLLVYSDGGPDHRVTYGGVKLSLIVLFKELDLDILIAARTAPGHSWANPAERIMSLLNIAYQNVALFREEMDSTHEQMLRSCNGMSDIRKKALKEEGLKAAWLQSVQTVKEILESRTGRVELKGKKFQCHSPASEEEVHLFESQVLQLVDPEIALGKYTKADMKGLEGYNDFIRDHCIERNYIFQVRKCRSASCCTPIRNSTGILPPFLPDPVIKPNDRDHYKPFSDVLGTDTSEADMPSAQSNTPVAKVAEEQQGCPNRLLVAQNVRSTVSCYECEKPRCIYSRKALTAREDRSLRRLLDKYQYSCGSIIVPDGDSLQGTVFVRLQLSCNSPIEIPYYTGLHRVGRPDLCCYCASPDSEQDEEAKKEFRVVLPMCATCKTAGRPVLKRLSKK